MCPCGSSGFQIPASASPSRCPSPFLAASREGGVTEGHHRWIAVQGQMASVWLVPSLPGDLGTLFLGQ